MQISPSVKVQFNIVLALIIKELQVRFGTKKLGYLWLLLEPILHIIPFYFIRKLFGNWRTEELIIFLVTGIVAVLFFTKSVTKIQSSISANQALLVYRQIKPIDIALSRLIIECIISFGIFVLMLCIFILFFGKIPTMRIFPLAIFAILAYIVLTFSCGLILMILVTRMPFLEAIIPQIIRIIYFISGGFFSVSDLPYSIRSVVLLNPIVHIVEILRFNLMLTQVKYYGNASYIFISTILALFLALFLYFLNKAKLV
jgi:capsular polysaccharide transport system permease protein